MMLLGLYLYFSFLIAVGISMEEDEQGIQTVDFLRFIAYLFAWPSLVGRWLVRSYSAMEEK